MKRLYVSTVGRGKLKEESSKIYCINYETGEIINSVRLPLAMFDLSNPRGGTRGARGLCFLNNKLYAAGWDGIFEINPYTLFINRGWWSAECRDIHQIYSCGNEILVVGTNTNSLWLFNPEKNEFIEIENYSNLKIGDKGSIDSHLGKVDIHHMNSVSENFALSSYTGSIINRKTKKVIIENYEMLKGAHDIIELKDCILINSSSNTCTLMLDSKTYEIKEKIFSIERDKSKDSDISKHGWTRGLQYVESKDLLLIGYAPASIAIINNFTTGSRFERIINISDEVCESVFDVDFYEDEN